MSLFFKRKPQGTSPLSEFIRNASSQDKKRVYTRVIEKATARQKAVMDRARSK